VPPLDPAIPEALRQGHIEQAKEALQRGPELAIFSARDHGGLLRIAGLARRAVQYEIGNPLTATRMVQFTDHQKREAIKRREQGETLADIARSYNVSPATISRLA
jgi:CENP-B N-terminal DNA-binding domain